MPPTRRRLGHRSTDRTGTGIPGRSDIRTQRSSGPGERKAPAGCNPGNAPENERERKEERRIPRVLYPSGDVPRPGRQNRKCGRGERPEHPRVQLGLAEPESEEARATGLRAVRVGLSRQKCRTYLPNTFLH